MRSATPRFILGTGFLGLVVTCMSLGDRVEAQSASRSLRIAVIDTLAPGLPTGVLAIAMRPFRTYMEEQVGTAGEITRGGGASAQAKLLREGSAQIGIFHGHEFAWVKEHYPTLEPLVVCVNPLRSVRAYLVVAAHQNVTSLTDLRGTTVALPRDSRDHCRLFFEQRCIPSGNSAETFYRRVTKPGTSFDALEEVASGRAQVTIVDQVTFERYRQEKPSRARQVKAAFQSEAFPPGVIAYDRERLAPADVTRLRNALVQAKDHPRGRQSLELLKLAGFESAPNDLEGQLRAINRAYPKPLGR